MNFKECTSRYHNSHTKENKHQRIPSKLNSGVQNSQSHNSHNSSYGYCADENKAKRFNCFSSKNTTDNGQMNINNSKSYQYQTQRAFGRELTNTNIENQYKNQPVTNAECRTRNQLLAKRTYRETQSSISNYSNQNTKSKRMFIEYSLPDNVTTESYKSSNHTKDLDMQFTRTSSYSQQEESQRRAYHYVQRRSSMISKSTQQSETDTENCYSASKRQEEDSIQIISSPKKHISSINLVEYSFAKDQREWNPIYQHARSIFDYLKNTETQFRSLGNMHNVQTTVTPRMRAILVDWLVDVHLKFKLVPETLYLTVNLIDRYMEKKEVLKEELQLLGLTAMFVACKYEEIQPPELSDFVFICDYLYTKQQILTNEGEMITLLEFKLGFSSPHKFLQRLTFLQGSTDQQFYCCQYLIELCLLEYKMNEYPSSILAASSVLLVNKIFEVGDPWSEELRLQTGYEQKQLKQCSKELWNVLKMANKLQEKCQKQIEDIETQEKQQLEKLSCWYKQEQMNKQKQEIDLEKVEQLELEYAQKKKDIEKETEELKTNVFGGNKNLLSVIRKFSLKKFQEAAKLFLKL